LQLKLSAACCGESPILREKDILLFCSRIPRRKQRGMREQLDSKKALTIVYEAKKTGNIGI
jgi:hypothetical protein